MTASETTPLLSSQQGVAATATATATAGGDANNEIVEVSPWRAKLVAFVYGGWYRPVFVDLVILLNVAVLASQTVLLAPAISGDGGESENDNDEQKQNVVEFGYRFQFAVVALYAIDCILNFVASPDKSVSRRVLGFWALVDLAAIIPFVVWASRSGGSGDSQHHLLPISLRTTTWIRVLRLLKRDKPQKRIVVRRQREEGTDESDGIQSRNLVGRIGAGTIVALTSDPASVGGAGSVLAGVFREQAGVLGTAAFVGITTWMAVSALYYLAERRNPQMIYCPDSCNEESDDGGGGDGDSSSCTIDYWGSAECGGKCAPGSCYNLYESIPTASYYALLNLFGEFPLATQHTVGGMVVGTVTAVVAVAVFALPVGIIGNGFAGALEKRAAERKRIAEAAAAADEANAGNDDDDNNGGGDGEGDGSTTARPVFYASDSTFRGRMYNFWFARTTPLAVVVNHAVNALVLVTCLTYMYETTITTRDSLSPYAKSVLNSIEIVSVLAFTAEYLMKLYAVVENPKYGGGSDEGGGGGGGGGFGKSIFCCGGRWRYVGEFMPVVDLLSFAPFWIAGLAAGGAFSFSAETSQDYDGSGGASIVATLRILRILRFEQYTQAFTTFDEVIMANIEVLGVTAAVAVVLWVLLGFALYYTEFNNPDPEMASNYSTVPNAMWITLLNLSGESPLCQYSVVGKVITGLLGLFATGLFGIPIGVLGSGFEEIVTEEHADNTAELEAAAAAADRTVLDDDSLGTPFERALYRFANGIGSTAARTFEAAIYFLIFLVVGVGIWQTVDGHENDWHNLELVAVVVFTVEYLIRFIGAGADPEFAKGWGCGNPILVRLRYIVSFYSVVDLLAIVPYYVAAALPNSLVDQYDEYLRMFRILRLIKLDKYVPSITLLDDVIRLKFNSLRVAMYAAVTLWMIFAAMLFLCEHNDGQNDIDPVPKYLCDEDCTMLNRFQNFFDSMVYTGIHLTGDYPITTYTWPARVVNFFMVIAAVGVVSIPSGLIASGFVEIVQSKNSARRGEAPHGRAGDDWYEHRYRELEGVDPPPSKCGPKVDAWQVWVNQFLNGEEGDDGHTKWTTHGYVCRVFIFTVIIANVAAVLLESIPWIDKAVGNQAGNFFDVFEMFSVMVFACEYILRLFCAPKNREALYSSWVYATTFFGIVDLLSTAPWFVEQALIASKLLDAEGDNAKIFRIFRIFRILQLEDFVVAFSLLDNVFRASKDVLKATGLLAIIIWVGCGALFFIFEENNPNWRTCDPSVPVRSEYSETGAPGCFDFTSTKECNSFYPGMCTQSSFTSMPNALFYTAVFLGGEWAVVDFTWPGRFVCLFLCVVGIALYAIPIGTLFDSFGAVLGLCDEDDDEGCEEEEGTGVGNDEGNGGAAEGAGTSIATKKIE